MRKIAFISDVHSNIAALETVVREIWNKGIEEIYCLGDIVGYHTFPNEVVDFLRSREIFCLKGNHDLEVIQQKFNDHKSPDIMRWTYETLTEENRRWLMNLPEQFELDIETQRVLLVHGSPVSIDAYCFPNDPATKQVMANLEQDILICGHTHKPGVSYYGPKTLMNAGSVGKPKIGKPFATWLEVSFFNALINARIQEIMYPYEAVADHVAAQGFIKYAEELRTGIVG